MAYDEVSFLNGVILGRAMKGFSMANPNNGNLLRVQARRVAAVARLYGQPEALPVFPASSLALSSYSWDLQGQTIEKSLTVPAALGLENLGASSELTTAWFSLEAELSDGLTASIGAELSQKEPDLELYVPGTPEGLGGALTAAATIIIGE